MNRLSFSRFQFALGLPLALATTLILGGAGVLAANINAPEKLNRLEEAISGSKHEKQAIEQRVKALEIKVFAKVQKGSLSSRINALEKFAGMESAETMPPLPPQFDNSKEPLKQAPELAVSGCKGSLKHSPFVSSKGGADKELGKELEEAVKLHHEGKVFEAERSLKKILEKSPTNEDAYFSLGAIAEARGDLQAALEYYTTAMQTNPNDSEARDAVTELSRKITAARTEAIVNPLAPPVADAPGPVLQGRAWELGSGASGALAGPGVAGQGPLSGQVCRPPIPTVPVTQPLPLRTNVSSTIARTLARAALGAALSGTGLHCPVCHMMRF